MDVLARIVVWLNAIANVLGKSLLAPIGVLPGWLSVAIVSTVTGVLMLLVYKYTSNQRAIQQVKDDIKANLLALKLFPDSASTVLRSQGRILLGALRLLSCAIVPLLVMLVPFCLILGQLALWFEFRPLHVGENAVATLKLKEKLESYWPDVNLGSSDAVKTKAGPVRVSSQREVCWDIEARQKGYHRLVFRVGEHTTQKELAIGEGFMRVSSQRPAWLWSDALWHPCETPFGPDSPIHSITIDYPERSWWLGGNKAWVGYWFAGSMIAALCFRRIMGVNF
jgi:hypothetical protein